MADAMRAVEDDVEEHKETIRRTNARACHHAGTCVRAGTGAGWKKDGLKTCMLLRKFRSSAKILNNMIMRTNGYTHTRKHMRALALAHVHALLFAD